LDNKLADQIVRNVFSRSGSSALHLPVGGVPFVSTIVLFLLEPHVVVSSLRSMLFIADSLSRRNQKRVNCRLTCREGLISVFGPRRGSPSIEQRTREISAVGGADDRMNSSTHTEELSIARGPPLGSESGVGSTTLPGFLREVTQAHADARR
jgi:hypothetical protein